MTMSEMCQACKRLTLSPMNRSLRQSITPFILTLSLFSCSETPKGKKPLTKDSVIEDPNIRMLKEQIGQYPDSIRLYDRLIDRYTAANDLNAATALCDTLLNRDAEKNFSYWFVKGDLQRQAQQYDKAIASYQHYLERFPDDEQILLNLANTMAEAAKPECLTLADALMKRVSTKEMQANANFIKGVFYSRTGQYDKAIACLDNSITAQYSFLDAYIEKSIAQYDQKRFDDAIRTLQQLQAVNSAYPDAYYWLGKCYEAKGDVTTALKQYEAAYGLDKTFVFAKEKIDSLRR